MSVDLLDVAVAATPVPARGPRNVTSLSMIPTGRVSAFEVVDKKARLGNFAARVAARIP